MMSDYFLQLQAQFKHKHQSQQAQNEQICSYIRDLERNNLAKMNNHRF